MKITFTISYGKRLCLMALLFVFFFAVTSVLNTLVLWAHPADARWVRIAVVLQDVFLFIMPALVTAMVVTRFPADLLGLRQKPVWATVFWAAAALVAFVPAMNVITTLNNAIHLPQALSGIEDWMRQAEVTSQNQIKMVIGAHTPGSLLLGIAIIGLLAGFSEELLFRGCLQRLLSSGRMRVQAAIWLSAVIFSVFHFQFYGFVPRMLLGALFGYVFVWSGSLWASVALHALNNTLYLLSDYFAWSTDASDIVPGASANLSGTDILPGVMSLVAGSACLVIARRVGRTHKAV